MALAKSSLRFAWLHFRFGIVLLGLILVAHDRFIEAFDRMDLIASDLRINTIAPHPSSGVIAIAAIDDKSITQLGQWPWPRIVLARLTDALKDYQVKVIGFDAIFSEADKSDVSRGEISQKLAQRGLSGQSISDVLGPSNDEAFANAMKSQSLTVLGYAFQSHHFQSHYLDRTSGFIDKIRPPGPQGYGIVRQAPGKPHDLITALAYQPPYALLDNAAHSIGYFDVDADVGGEIRGELTVIRFDGRYCVPIFMAVADAFANGAPMMLGVDRIGVSGVSLAGVQIPVDERGQMLINFRRGIDPFPHYSISDIINHKIAPEKLAGKNSLGRPTAPGTSTRRGSPLI